MSMSETSDIEWKTIQDELGLQIKVINRFQFPSNLTEVPDFDWSSIKPERINGKTMMTVSSKDQEVNVKEEGEETISTTNNENGIGSSSSSSIRNMNNKGQQQEEEQHKEDEQQQKDNIEYCIDHLKRYYDLGDGNQYQFYNVSDRGDEFLYTALPYISFILQGCVHVVVCHRLTPPEELDSQIVFAIALCDSAEAVVNSRSQAYSQLLAASIRSSVPVILIDYPKSLSLN
ncbi:hypothetical protein PPL_06426 [Heterostelium album PN500]|uniref:Uncharacterized protein n=1 Tax=Heterostelium pallidum (strain ATCC 26659 / Pp 5 / PN500) TaxID=670386 RepID=D3BD46_HETP5|nr:hypothetical protein PPL_06426 [Heterostelium album PN500]EFA80838.1 hypothetical protein PPL_06426 [Heterostelium album PN500]|eukprot:XP_020432957.1 hypothetical protein PPL_06426 [Heterostelium album PN500]